MDTATIEIHNIDSPRAKVKDILAMVTSSCDFGSVTDYGDRTDDPEAHVKFWREVLSNKVSDSGFQRLVHRLIEDGWDNRSAVGLETTDDGGWYITEGHHRLCAAILLCMDEVPYEPWGQDSDHRVSAHSGPDRMNALGLEF